jgi:hypothetical protein
MKMKVLQRVGFFLFLSLLSVSILAQGTTSCPANVLLALARAGAACATTTRNQACFGNGTVSATFQPGVGDVSFSQPGAIMNTADLQRLSIGAPESEFSVVIMQTQANLPDSEQRSVTVFLFGDAEITDMMPPIPELLLASTGQLNIRTLPDINAEIVERVNVRGNVIANGRTEDGQWLRVLIPGTSELGWVSPDSVTSDSHIASLDVVDIETAFYRPFQFSTIRTRENDAPCAGAPNSGVLIQTPNEVLPVEMTINGVKMQVAATVFVQAQAGGTMVVNVLDGFVEMQVGDTSQFVPAGARSQVALGEELLATGGPSAAEPYVSEDFVGLPINNLAFRFSLLSPLTQAQIDTLVAEYYTLPPTPVPTASPDPDACRRVMRRNDDLRAGPGLFYEVVTTVEAGRSLDPVFQANDPDGKVWWQLRSGSWVRLASVEITGKCDEIPVTNFISAPSSNELRMETCETSNGPLREGQWVEIEFIPPAFESAKEAEDAPYIDPGTVKIDEQRYRVYAGNPIRIAEERYIVEFYAYWTATAGSHRIIAERLHYILICDLTVPVG